MNETIDHDTCRRWLDLDLDPARRSRLEAHLADCPACAAEARFTADLHAALAADRVEVRPGFRDGVMAALPAAPWAAPARHAWRLPAAAAAVFLALASMLLLVAGDAGPAGALAATAATVGDLFATTLLAGAGLLAASWKGTGLVVEQSLADSTGGLVALVVLVLSLNVLLFSLLRRRRDALATNGANGANGTSGTSPTP
jgi:predicted anti-sigma-YlaC factor YlaD